MVLLVPEHMPLAQRRNVLSKYLIGATVIVQLVVVVMRTGRLVVDFYLQGRLTIVVQQNLLVGADALVGRLFLDVVVAAAQLLLQGGTVTLTNCWHGRHGA